MSQSAKKTVKFVLSVDTEEEWDWAGPFPKDNCAVSNVQKIPEFQSFCNQYGIKPTYFVDYAVVSDPASVSVLKEPLAKLQCEIAGHLHPWCNPPYFGETTEFDSHVINLPTEQVKAKLAVLTDKLRAEFGVSPRAFRTGRWGISGDVLKLLVEQGYDIDSSVYPFYRHEYFSCSGAPIHPYWPAFDNVLKPGQQKDILQLPVTVGFNNRHFETSHQLHKMLEQPVLKWLRPVGVAWHLGILKKYYLCPELSTGEEMIELVKNVLKRNEPILHMYMHSSSLIPGATGFMKKGEGAQTIIQRIEKVFSYLEQHAKVECMTISETADWYKKDLA